MLAIAIKIDIASTEKALASPKNASEVAIIFIIVAALISFCYGTYNYIIKNHDESHAPEKNEKSEL